MQPLIRVGRIAGIEIGVHYTWLLIAVLITGSFIGYLSDIHRLWPARTIWSAAIVISALFFLSVMLHEMASWGCCADGWRHGGRAARDGSAVLELAESHVGHVQPDPRLPLDGGRVLRAILSWIGGDEIRATRIASLETRGELSM